MKPFLLEPDQPVHHRGGEEQLVRARKKQEGTSENLRGAIIQLETTEYHRTKVRFQNPCMIPGSGN